MSSRDGNVRDTHQIDGQTVIVGERFSNGVAYPGEGGTAPAQEVVNCRCTTVPVMKRPPAPSPNQ